MKNIPLFIMLLVTGSAFAQTNTVQLVNPATVAAPRGYSHAAVIDLGTCTMVIISGQVALDSAGNLAGKGDIARQTEQVFTNIKNIVASQGGTMDNLVKLGYFVTDISQIQTIRDVRNRFINTQHPPASTLVQVNKLFREDVMIEVEATAVIPKK